MFQLGRPDVWPVDDLGVRNGWARIHDMETPPTAEGLPVLGDAAPPVPEHCRLVLLAARRRPDRAAVDAAPASRPV